jgi:3-dehydroquinate synthase
LTSLAKESFFVDKSVFNIEANTISNVNNLIIKSKLGDYKVVFRHFDLNDDFLDSILSDNTVLIIDSFLLNIYDLRVRNSMILLKASEETKTFENTQYIINEFIAKNVNKGTKIIAIGGGVIQDVTAFTSAIFRRGLDWVYYPSTLLSQSDSCIGAKTALNYKNNKNLIGLFSSPFEVIINSSLNKTLNKIDLINGYGEIIKLSIIAGETFFVNAISLVDLEVSDVNIQNLIKQSLIIKKQIIEYDEFEESVRQVLNYGHTIGHAIEAESEFKIPHGIAVLMGILIENRIALEYGLCEYDFISVIEDVIFKIIGNLFSELGLFGLCRQNLFERLRLDKKIKNDNLPTILPKTYGEFITFELTINSSLFILIDKIFDEIEHGSNY